MDKLAHRSSNWIAEIIKSVSRETGLWWKMASQMIPKWQEIPLEGEMLYDLDLLIANFWKGHRQKHPHGIDASLISAGKVYICDFENFD